MSVRADRVGSNVVVTVTTDITDILALVGVSAAEKKVKALERAAAEFQRSLEAHRTTDAVLDARVTDATAAVAALKAARPTGNL